VSGKKAELQQEGMLPLEGVTEAPIQPYVIRG
jgi:hypothetical protein